MLGHGYHKYHFKTKPVTKWFLSIMSNDTLSLYDNQVKTFRQVEGVFPSVELDMISAKFLTDKIFYFLTRT